MKQWIKHIYFELYIWIVALIALAVMDCSGEHYSLCVAKWIGLPWCPGCGIGHAIHEAFHGNWVQSFQYHPLGIPAVLILFYRITVLTRLQIASINSYIAFNKKPI